MSSLSVGEFEGSRILIVANYSYSVWLFRRDIVAALIGLGAEVHVLAGEDEYTAKVEELGVRMHTTSVSFNNTKIFKEFILVKEWVKVYKSVRPDLIHHFTIKPNLYGPVLTRLFTKARSVSTVTGMGSVFLNKGLVAGAIKSVVKAVYRFSLKRSSEVFMVNLDDIRLFSEQNIVPSEKIQHIYGAGVDLGYFQEPSELAVGELYKRYGLVESKGIILFVGRMIKDKGVLDLIDQFRILEEPDLQLVLVGQLSKYNPGSIDIENLVQRIAGVSYLGVVDDLRSLYKAADVVVLPSSREGMPTVLMEAAAMGVPCVAYDVPGCREAIINGETGYLVRFRDPAELWRKVVSIARDQTLSTFLGHNAKLKSKRFDRKQIVDAHLKCYQYLLAQR